MDVVTYAIVKGLAANLEPGYNYKGSVSATTDLPESATKGDLYTVDGVQYVWDGSDWINIETGVAITEGQIDALFT